jgi:hypothetical protein
MTDYFQCILSRIINVLHVRLNEYDTTGNEPEREKHFAAAAAILREGAKCLNCHPNRGEKAAASLPHFYSRGGGILNGNSCTRLIAGLGPRSPFSLKQHTHLDKGSEFTRIFCCRRYGRPLPPPSKQPHLLSVAGHFLPS